jgi:hypothetical protein
MYDRNRVRRFFMALAAVTAMGVLPATVTAESAPPPCEDFCRTGWSGCFVGAAFGITELEFCDAWYDGCLYGCKV